jgi:XTP/dITP diphosphohydrolase
MNILLIATRNAHKVGEIRTILGESFCYLTLKNFPSAPEVVEDAETFAGNAVKKAKELACWITHSSTAASHPLPDFVLADDSGLEVHALGGKPGVHSARFAAMDEGGAGNSLDVDNNAKLLRLMKDLPVQKRTARFRCILALTPVPEQKVESASPVCYADEFEMPPRLFEGFCEGRILFAPSGRGGFGYDPLFVPDGFDRSFAELGEAVKNQISHRSRALEKLKSYLVACP